MVNPAARDVSDAPDVLANGQRRWPAAAAFVTAWWLPATTARRTEHVRLSRAYAVHVVAAVLAILLLTLLAACRASDALTGVPATLRVMIGEFAGDVARGPGRFVLVFVAGVLIVELGFASLALIIMPWGARDERVSSSLGNAVRQAWLHTADVLPIVVLVGTLTLSIDHARHDWVARGQQLRPPQWTGGRTGSRPARGEHDAAVRQWRSQRRAPWEAWMRSRPWRVRNEGAILGYAYCIGATWFLWALLRATGVRRPAPAIAHPPLCEACGYNLTGVTNEGRCPECGEPVADSLDPGARPGTPWERRREVGRWRAWWRCCLDPVLRPAAFGRQVQLCSSRLDHRRFLVMHLVPIFCLGALAILVGYPVVTGYPWPFPWSQMLGLVGPLFGYLYVTGTLLFVLAAAGLVGLVYRISDGRNLMSGTMQVAAYLSGYLVALTIFALVTGLIAGAMKDHLHGLALILRTDDESAAFLCWLPPNLTGLLWSLTLLGRATGGLRYANR